MGLTTVCRQVLRRLTEAGDVAVVYLPQLRTEKPFWQEVCFQLGCAEEGAIYNSGGKGLNSNALAGLARGKIRSLGGVIMLLDCEAGLPADDSNTIKALLGLTATPSKRYWG